MCGISGILYHDSSQTVVEDVLRRSADAIAHRGPDAAGYWTEGNVGLAHRRLSIIDLAGGDQPMGNEDGSVQVVFNGEIYNFRELREQLERRGHHFRTRSDTEVLVHLYEEEGDRFVERLRGMFAFALWDGRQQRLLLARDRIGLKPLYYYRDHEKFLFGSEIKAILAVPDVGREIDPEALEDFLAYGVICGARSIFRGVRKLAPAHVLVVEPGRPERRPHRYWQLQAEPDDALSLEEWQEAVEEKIVETVRAHRIADVPVGAFLSGGLDSSALVATLAQSGEETLQTFSIGFHEEAFSELPYARQVARRYGTQHVEEIVTPEAVHSLEELVHFYDEPFADASAIPTMCVSRLARRHVKVVLSGDGGDEAFGGYSRYAHDLREAGFRKAIPKWLRLFVLSQLAAMWPKADWLPRPLRAKTALTNLSLDAPAAYANTISLCRPPLRRQLLSGDVQRLINGYRPESQVVSSYSVAANDPLRGMIAADVAVLLPDDFLTKVDRASMAVGLEVRPPLVDHELLELSARIPSRWKIQDGETKWLLKRLYQERLPRDVVWRKKQGFELPVDQWLRGPLRELFEASVLSTTSRLGDYVNQTTANRLYRSHLAGVGRHGGVLWSLLVLGCWMETYLGQSVPREAAAHLAS